MLSLEETTLYFIVAFAIGIVWYRLLFFIVPLYFKRPFTRSTLKIRWHHLHWGIVFALIGSVLLLRSRNITISSAILLGLGLGLVVDLFIPSLLLETNRDEELVVYRKTLFSTLFLAVVVIIFLVVFLSE